MPAPKVIAAAIAVFAVLAALGAATAPTTAHPSPLRLEHGVPVVIADTPQGAVAAAENYLVAEDQALLDPARLRLAVDIDWTSQERQVELSQGLTWMALPPRTTTQGAAGRCGGSCYLTAAVAAIKLESFAPTAAQVSVWHELAVWGPAFEPSQYWMLDMLALVWSGGRWLVSSRSTAPGSQTPIPAFTNGTAADRTSQAWTQRLAGMSVPYYGGSG